MIMESGLRLPDCYQNFKKLFDIPHSLHQIGPTNFYRYIYYPDLGFECYYDRHIYR